MGFFKSIFEKIAGKQAKPAEPVDYLISGTKLQTMHNEYHARMDVLEKNVRRLNAQVGREIGELTAEIEELEAERDAQGAPGAPAGPGNEAELAQELLNWGYTAEQLPKIKQWYETNKAGLQFAAQMAGIKDDPNKSPVETLREHRAMIEMALANHGIKKANSTAAQSDEISGGTLHG